MSINVRKPEGVGSSFEFWRWVGAGMENLRNSPSSSFASKSLWHWQALMSRFQKRWNLEATRREGTAELGLSIEQNMSQ